NLDTAHSSSNPGLSARATRTTPGPTCLIITLAKAAARDSRSFTTSGLRPAPAPRSGPRSTHSLRLLRREIGTTANSLYRRRLPKHGHRYSDAVQNPLLPN